MTEPSGEPREACASPRRRRWFVLAAIGCGLLPVLLLEIGLRFSGGGEPTRHADPLVGFSRISPLFEREEQAGLYRTARSRQVLFGRQEFTIAKPENGRRIFCLGGSTVRGRPYTTRTAFPRWLQLELTARDPDRPCEVVNCGGLSYASYRLTNILREVLQYEPDLIVIATGHNEFLEDRTYADIKQRSSARAWLEDRLLQLRSVQLARQLTEAAGTPATVRQQTVLPELVDARLDQASGYASYHRDEVWARGVQDHFEQSLRTMVALCRSENVPVLLVLLGSNVRDCPPFKSEHRDGITLEQERLWQSHYEQAESLETVDPQRALAAYRQAATIDDQYALLRYRIGRLLDAQGHTDEAATHYLAAKDEDICPLRMPESFVDVLRTVADQTGTPLIDARELIAAGCAGRLPGNDCYLDHVHPGIGAHQQIAAALARHVLPSTETWPDESRRRIYARHLQSLGPIYLTNGNERVSWLENWARRHRLREDALPHDPAAHLRYGHRLWDFARQDEAWTHYTTALDARPELVSQVLSRCDRLDEQGRNGEALQLLDRLARSAQVTARDDVARYRARLTRHK